jgi:multiple sugar transport system substrate-binding protein
VHESPPGAAVGTVSFMVFGEAAEYAAYKALVAAFQAGHPQVVVELVHVPGQSEYRQRLVTDLAAGTPPDVVLLNYRRYAEFAAKGALAPLGPYLAASLRLREAAFYPAALVPFRWAGTLMCLPQNLSSLVVYYNKTLFDRSGVPYPRADWGWADFVQTAVALTKDLDGDGARDQYGLGTDPTLFRLAPFIWQNGGELTEGGTGPTGLALSAPPAQVAVQWFVDLQTRHHVVPDAAAERALSSERRFLAGSTAMFLNSRRGVPAYREGAHFDWDVAPLPRGRYQVGLLHSDAYCLLAAAKHKTAAWAFIEFANSVDGQALVAASGRTVPSLRVVAESPAFLDPAAKPRASTIFLDVLPHVRAVPVMEAWTDIEAIVDEELARAFYGHASVGEALEAAAHRTRPLFRR